MNKFGLLVISASFLIPGCSSIKSLAPAEMPNEPVAKADFIKLNGKYNILPDTVYSKVKSHISGYSNPDLLDLLFLAKTSGNYKNAAEIRFISGRTAVVNVYFNEELVDTKVIRGRFRRGYFYQRPKFFIVPFFPVYFWRHHSAARIGKTSHGIVIDYGINEWGFAIIAGGFEKGHTTCFFKSVNN